MAPAHVGVGSFYFVLPEGGVISTGALIEWSVWFEQKDGSTSRPTPIHTHLHRFIGMGGKEYSGIRKKEAGQEVFDRLVASYPAVLERALKTQGVTEDR